MFKEAFDLKIMGHQGLYIIDESHTVITKNVQH